MRLLGVVAKLEAQTADAHGYGRFAHAGGIPDLFGQGLGGDDSPLVAHQVREQVPLGGSKVDFLAADHYPAPAKVNHEPRARDHAFVCP